MQNTAIANLNKFDPIKGIETSLELPLELPQHCLHLNKFDPIKGIETQSIPSWILSK